MKKSFLREKFIFSGSGFTIIELIVVVAVISVLAAIVLSNVSAWNQKGKDAAIKNEMGQIFLAAQQYYQAHGNYGGMFDTNDQSEAEAAEAARVIQRLVDQLPAFQDCKANETKSDSNSWAACAVLNNPSNKTIAWCIDYSGSISQICASDCTTSKLAGAGACPTATNPSSCTALQIKNNINPCLE